MVTPRRAARLARVLRQRQPDLTVVCENIHDRHNVSAILRTCDAVGVHQVHLLYTIERFPRLGKQSSGAAKKWLDVVRHDDMGSLRAHLAASGHTTYATSLAPDSISIYDVDWTRPAAIIFGNEHRGVSEEAVAAADELVTIPMHGLTPSLNVSVAAAVVLFEAARQRRRAGRYPNPDIDPEWLSNELRKWLAK